MSIEDAMAAPDGHTPLAAPDGDAWDLLVLGGGTAGLVTAKTAAGFGASVLLVEADKTGGECLWTGCVPSKALLAAAHAAADARAAGTRHGVHVADVRIDGEQVLAHVRRAIAIIEPVDSPAALTAAGVQVVPGSGTLTGPTTASVDGVEVPFRQAVLCTGSQPTRPDIAGLPGVGALTNETVWDLTALPKSLLVLGGGSIGCELGQAFARLGAAVTLIESGSRLLPREDADAAELVSAALVSDGVDVRTDAHVTAAGLDGARRTLTLADGTTLAAEHLLVAVGRAPATSELGLAAGGVQTDEAGWVRVDDRLQTSNPRIWAAGDVTGPPQLTHLAGVHGSTAATNAVLGLRRSIDHDHPRVTFTQPEVAAVGRTDHLGRRHVVRTTGHDDIDRAVTDGRREGFTRLVLDRRGRIVGGTIVGPRAGESLAEVALAVRKGLHARDIAATTHAYPTYGDGAWNAAIEHVRLGLRRPVASRATSMLGCLRRRWLSR